MAKSLTNKHPLMSVTKEDVSNLIKEVLDKISQPLLLSGTFSIARS